MSPSVVDHHECWRIADVSISMVAVVSVQHLPGSGMMNRLRWCVILFVGGLALNAQGAERSVSERLAQETWVKDSRLVVSAIGVTRRETPIPCMIDRAELADEPTRHHVWLIGGLDGTDESVDSTINLLRWFHTSDQTKGLRKSIAVSAVVIANPDGWVNQTGAKNLSDGVLTRSYPPPVDGYQSATVPEAQYLWRWLGIQAPDIVIECRLVPRQKLLEVDPTRHEEGDFVREFQRHSVAGMGKLLALRRNVGGGDLSEAQQKWIRETAETFEQSFAKWHSEARLERLQRIRRSPIEVAEQLAKRYGHSLKTVQYIPAVAVIGRLRLSELTNDPSHRQDAERIVLPYISGDQKAISDKPSGSDFAGHLVFGELAQRTTDAATKGKLIALAKAAADFGFDDQGQLREAMPAHAEMSDAVFMSCPILAQVGRLTGDNKYHDMAVRHLGFMRKLCARPDGLYRNSPLNNAAWGRGNGFPALGLALTLTDLPAEHPGRPEVLRAFQEHLAALKLHQDPTGMWHQVIDVEGSYRELTATCMITFAMLRGMKQGWLDRATYEPCVRKAWPAILARIGSDGSLIDVCEGTGKQTTLRAYLDRKAILGPDDRGGAMSLLVATEMAAFERRPVAP
jgi:rhamnogalacturonyl hydrolase YesR